MGYTDVNFSSYPNSQYYVEAVLIAGACQPTRSGYAVSRSNLKHFGTSGIKQLNNSTTINIYPNPANNTISITGITEKTTIRMFDIIGKLIIEKEVEQNTTINTSNLAEGVYTMFTEDKMNRAFSKVLINR